MEEREKVKSVETTASSQVPVAMPEPKKIFEGSVLQVWSKNFEVQNLLPKGAWDKISTTSNAQLKWCDGVRGVIIDDMVYVPVIFNDEKNIAVISLK